ncbi:MAG: carotenoid oxygenase family protein [Verrucomicrobia bacterium]|nr:carotenoid oxygenase family protein [Verrucomicrobiota bacterium]
MPKIILLALCLLACNTQQPSKSFQQAFYDSHLLFDMDTEVSRQICPVKGEIPSWLSGTLLRNGPAKFQVGDRRVDWFDGLAMLHAFEFNSQQVTYTNRFLRSQQYYLMMEGKSLDFPGFAADPCPQTFKNQLSLFVPEDKRGLQNADVSIQEYADKMVALTEVPLPVVFDPQSLDTVGVLHYQDALHQGEWESAHPQRDVSSGETFNYFVRFGQKSSYVIWKMQDGASTRKILAEIPVDQPAYMHSFALTERYVVLTEFPFVVHPLDLMLKKKPFIFNYKWKPERGTLFHVVDRSTGKTSTFKGAPFFAFHHVNAYDQEGKIFIDIVTYSNAEVIDRVTDHSTDANPKDNTKLERFTLDLAAQTLSQETLFDQSLELPRVSALKTAHTYRYCYATDARFPASAKDLRSLYKMDVQTKAFKSWSEEGCYPGEPIFVPNPDKQAEDEGVILSVILDITHHRSFLLILNAPDFAELARAEVPHAIPAGLHGLWKNR